MGSVTVDKYSYLTLANVAPYERYHRSSVKGSHVTEPLICIPLETKLEKCVSMTTTATFECKMFCSRYS